MELRFIGTDGSMGLTTGKVYHVEFHTAGRTGGKGYLRALIYDCGKCIVECPYSSIKAFTRNWEEV
jgi:hypothetical protein